MKDQFKNIEELDFTHNAIRKIEANAFDVFEKLKILKLSNNLLKSEEAMK